MKETYGEYNLQNFLEALHREHRLIKSIFYDYKYNAWMVVVEEYRIKKPKQLKLF